MARRANPERIYVARRAAIASRLAQSRVLSPEAVERRLAAWETHIGRPAMSAIIEMITTPA